MKKSVKKRIKLRILFVLLMIFLVTIGLTKVNIINTKALSPLDDTNENYKKVSEAFGEDFSNFIRDNASVKIYKDDSDEILVKVGEKDYKITKESSLINQAEKMVDGVGDFFTSIKDKVEKVIM
ncbi:hypothetical protein NNC19_00170 [Clostridium sp. SHJSY1]|uniref:hypothetical protein n=1 Tax=Clostridium sp. SHJSY1 TaxID=2942483 RepID=UPI0028757E1D|nr:hypothetical protein [Clostridium sp. SHJSY1]MDS0524068.1 hypothetical protein [Clostridium sp. SHJSY1]